MSAAQTAVRVPTFENKADVILVERWLKRVGDKVTAGDPLVIFQTERSVTVEFPAPRTGRLRTVYVKSGEAAFQGEVVGTIEASATPPPSVERGLPAKPSPQSTDGEHRRTTTTRIFICYRREDTSDAADRLHDRLVQTYSAERVFMDVDSVPLGVNFVRYIAEQLRQCGAVLVMIGRNWSKVTDDSGNRRLDDPADHVRVEIATALKQGVPVIPLLVQDAVMPRANDLSEDIRDLAFHNGMALPRAFWGQSVERLLKELDKVMKP